MPALQRDPGRSFRPRLTRAVIIDVAGRIARDEGIAALSMRRIADELDSAPMSLYRHVADREDLLLAMLDRVAAHIQVPLPVADPRAEITALVTAVHEALSRDAWAVQVLVTDQLASPLILPVVDRIFGALRRAGMSVRESIGAHGLMFQFVYGEILSVRHDLGDASRARKMVREAEPERFPNIAEIVAATPPYRPSEFFRENLECIVDGLFAHRAGGARPS